VKGCMWIEESRVGKGKGGEGSESEGEGFAGGGEGRGGGKIAWRYARMKRFQTTVSGYGPGEWFASSW